MKTTDYSGIFSQLAFIILYYKHTSILSDICLGFISFIKLWAPSGQRYVSHFSLFFFFFFKSFICFRRISLVRKQKLKLMFTRHVYIWMCVKTFKSSSHKYYLWYKILFQIFTFKIALKNNATFFSISSKILHLFFECECYSLEILENNSKPILVITGVI